MAEEVEWFVGVDWGSQSHQVCLVNARGECLGERAVARMAAWVSRRLRYRLRRFGEIPRRPQRLLLGQDQQPMAGGPSLFASGNSSHGETGPDGNGSAKGLRCLPQRTN